MVGISGPEAAHQILAVSWRGLMMRLIWAAVSHLLESVPEGLGCTAIPNHQLQLLEYLFESSLAITRLEGLFAVSWVLRTCRDRCVDGLGIQVSRQATLSRSS